MTVTADTLLPHRAAPSDRRRSARFKLTENVTAIFGRGTGTLIDISASGARIRHTASVARGAQVRVKFEWKGERFEAAGEVLASRVAGIGPDGTLFESRIRFVRFLHDASAVLERALADLSDANLRKWVANLRGWAEDDAPAAPQRPAPRTFLRCRYVNHRWVQRVTSDATQPVDGFTVAAGTDPAEVQALRRTFEQSDAEGRRLLQLLTGAVLQG